MKTRRLHAESIASRRTGALMLEMTLAITVLSVGALAFLSSFHANSLALNMVNQLDEAASAVTSVAEELTGVPIDEVYSSYYGRVIPVPALEGPDGQAARVEILFHVDETALPTAFGPIADIDGDPGSETTDASTSYQILPVELRLSYLTAHGTRLHQVFMVLGGD